MCGIAGIVDDRLDRRAQLRILRVMSRALTHRGPDDRGLLIDRDVAIAMRRLSIVDVALGHQPVYGEDCQVAAVLNGEIYNAHDLRARLLALGHRFTTRSDTEVIVHAYEQWGDGCVPRLQGMFALAVWDGRQSPPALLVARDRLGIKPLYYCAEGTRFAFASEVRALLKSGVASPRLSRTGLASYLAFGSVQEPVTLVEGVHSLPPGHLMRVSGGRRILRRYWDFPPAEPRPAGSLGAIARQVAVLLESAVRRQSSSETRIGTFLSGGMDSTALIAIASRLRAPMHTFTVRFAESAFDEGRAAARAATRWGSTHRQTWVSASDLLAELPRYLRAIDLPSMDGINTYFVARAAAEAQVPVALSGLGSDETFAGYSVFRTLPRWMHVERRWRQLPSWVRGGGVELLVATRSDDRGRKLRALLSGESYFDHPYFLTRALLTPTHRALVLRDAADGGECDELLASHVTSTVARACQYDDVTAISYLESSHYLVNTLLRDTDAMSMAHGVEVRVPFLDEPLLEHVMALPGAVKLMGRGAKPLLARAMALLRPGVALGRKQTFTFPLDRWLARDLKAPIEHALRDLPRPLADHLRGDAIEAMWTAFCAGRTSWSRPWALYVLREWVERNLN